MAGYLPESDQQFALWFNNFQAKFSGYATTFGFVAADVTALARDYAMFRYLLDTLMNVRPAVQALTAYKESIRDGPNGAAIGDPPIPGPFTTPPDTILAGVETRIRAIVQRIKAHPAYTTAIGEDLSIIAPESTPVTPKPTGNATALPNSEVRVQFVKRHFDGVYVESQRGAETTWTQVGVDLHSPYTDRRAPLAEGQPEVRRYRLRYFQHDAPVGDFSDVMTVTTQP